jgi:hypothetical protein
MRRHLLAPLLCLIAMPALAQQNAIGLGVGQSNATANPTASASGGQAGGGQSSLTINNNGQGDTLLRSRTDGTLDTRVSGGTVSRQTGGVRNAPAVFAPGLAAAGLETCLGSVSGGGSFMGGGFSFGTTVPDPGCAARLDSRTLWSMGLKKAAVARLCLQDAIQRSMPEVCAEYLPQPATASSGYVASAAVQAAAPPRLEPVEYNGGRVQVIEKRTGQMRWCEAYSNGRCLRWGR